MNKDEYLSQTGLKLGVQRDPSLISRKQNPFFFHEKNTESRKKVHRTHDDGPWITVLGYGTKYTQGLGTLINLWVVVRKKGKPRMSETYRHS